MMDILTWALASFAVWAHYWYLGRLEGQIEVLKTRAQNLSRGWTQMEEMLHTTIVAVGPLHQTHEGRVLRIADMTEVHLWNTWKACPGDKRALIEAELKKRSRDFVEDSAWNNDDHKVLAREADLQEEAEAERAAQLAYHAERTAQ